MAVRFNDRVRTPSPDCFIRLSALTVTAVLRIAILQAMLMPAFAAAGSRDAAFLFSADAGSVYTVHVAGVNNTTGEALVEVYEVP